MGFSTAARDYKSSTTAAVRSIKRKQARQLQEQYDTLNDHQPPSKKTKINLKDIDINSSDTLSTRTRKFRDLEDTFEHWLLEPKLNKRSEHVLRPIKEAIRIKKEEEEHNASDTSADDAGEITNTNELTDREKYYIHCAESGLHYQAPPAARLHLESRGLEHIPVSRTSHCQFPRHIKYLDSIEQFSTRHFRTLTTIVHINILRKNWSLAYKAVCILVRHPTTDIRAVWPLCLEVLTRRAEMKYKDRIGGDISEYTLRTFGGNTEETRMTIMKDEQFLSWLETFYPLVSFSSAYEFSRAYKAGSKDSAPLYVLDLIWSLILKQKFEAATEKVEHLLALQPYIDDGLFYFLQGLAYQLQADSLVRFSDDFGHKQQDILEMLANAEQKYEAAKSLGCAFPEKLVNMDLKVLRSLVLTPSNPRLATSTVSDQETSESENENQPQYDQDSFYNVQTTPTTAAPVTEDGFDDDFESRLSYSMRSRYSDGDDNDDDDDDD